MPKSRVTPMIAITIPKMKLTAALVSTKVSVVLRKEIHYQNINEIFWTDSKVVILYGGMVQNLFGSNLIIV